jgi:hypothetical protein
MSGGHFDYVQRRIFQAAEEVGEYIAVHRDSYTEDTVRKFAITEAYLRVAAAYLQRMDWLICGDDSEATFHGRLTADLLKLDEFFKR